MPKSTRLRQVLLGTLLAVSGMTFAQSFGFAPTVIQMDAEQALNAQTTIHNLGQQPAHFTVTAKTWRIQGNQSILEDTRDIIVNPTEFTLPPGAKQIIRLGLRKKPGADELTYRLQVRQQELPSSAAQDATMQASDAGTSLKVALSFSLPVYIAPGSAKARMSYGVTVQENDLLLRLTNSGNRHETYNNFVVERGGRQASVNSLAVLKASEVTVKLTDLGAVQGPLKLSFTNARGENVHETVSIP